MTRVFICLSLRYDGNKSAEIYKYKLSLTSWFYTMHLAKKIIQVY